jgi:ABC-type multidrug transport system permease subunit
VMGVVISLEKITASCLESIIVIAVVASHYTRQYILFRRLFVSC